MGKTNKNGDDDGYSRAGKAGGGGNCGSEGGGIGDKKVGDVEADIIVLTVNKMKVGGGGEHSEM